MALTLSFAGCSWLLTYHFGVVRFIQENLSLKGLRFAGASSGSVAALVLATGLPAQEAYDFAREMAIDAQDRRFGPVGRMSRYLHGGLDQLLPKDCVKKASGRLIVSVTELPRFRNRLVTVNAPMTREELILLIRASCYIPIYYERPVRMNGRYYVDGGLTNNLPNPGGEVISVSPTRRFQAGVHIAPAVPPSIKHAFFPDPNILKTLYRQGYEDAAQYWK